MARILSLLLITCLSLVLADDQQQSKFSMEAYCCQANEKNPQDVTVVLNVDVEDPFTFDYHQLRVGGLIVAAVLCLIGITILFSGHCRCKFNQDKRKRTGSKSATQQMLNDTARASEC